MQMRNPPSGPAVHQPSFANGPANVNVGAVASIDWSLAPAQTLTLSANCNVTSVRLPANEQTWVQLKVVQGGAGSFVPTFVGALTPGGTPLTLSTTPGAVDFVSLFWDGVTLFAQVAGLDFK